MCERTYYIKTNQHQSFYRYLLASNKKSFHLFWSNSTVGADQSTVIKVTDDEINIDKIQLSSDLLTVTVICTDATKPNVVNLQLNELIPEEVELTQEEIQEAVQRAKDKFKEKCGGRPMMCFTQIQHDEFQRSKCQKR